MTRCKKTGCLLTSRGGYCPSHAREAARNALIREGWSIDAVDAAQAHPLPGFSEIFDGAEQPLPPQGDA